MLNGELCYFLISKKFLVFSWKALVFSLILKKGIQTFSGKSVCVGLLYFVMLLRKYIWMRWVMSWGFEICWSFCTEKCLGSTKQLKWLDSVFTEAFSSSQILLLTVLKLLHRDEHSSPGMQSMAESPWIYFSRPGSDFSRWWAVGAEWGCQEAGSRLVTRGSQTTC